MKSFIFISTLFLSIFFLSSFTISSNTEDLPNKVDISSSSHTFTLDTIKVSGSKKVVLYSIYRDNKIQSRKIKVELDYGSSTKLNVFDNIFKRSGRSVVTSLDVTYTVYLVSSTDFNVSIELDTNKIGTRDLIDRAFKDCHIKS